MLVLPRIKELRKRIDKTQKELSEELNIPYRTIQRWESGENQIKNEKVKKLADYFSVSESYLLGYGSEVRSLNSQTGQKIKQIRLNKGMTLEEFGELFSASKGTVNNWEKGRNLPNKENLLKIAQLANTTVEELTRNSDLVTLTQVEFNRLKEIERKYNEIKRLVDD